jgi:Sulfotransferase family
MAPARVPEHVLQNAIALDAAKLLYVPVPRAGSTALLWALARSEGLTDDHFAASTKLEVTRALTIHDLTRWGGVRRLAGRGERELDEILRSDEWLRFTVVREPVRRLWSAWVTKILLRDPRFVRAFGAEDWFPRTIEDADGVARAFRAFAAVLADRPDAWHDPHWSSQVDLAALEQLDYSVVGRMEDLGAVLAVVDEHLRGCDRAPLVLGAENASLLPFTRGVLDAETAAACADWTARDRTGLGYPSVPAGDGGLDREWVAAVTASLPAVNAVAERNERIGDLRELLRRSRAS